MGVVSKVAQKFGQVQVYVCASIFNLCFSLIFGIFTPYYHSSAGIQQTHLKKAGSLPQILLHNNQREMVLVEDDSFVPKEKMK